MKTNLNMRRVFLHPLLSKRFCTLFILLGSSLYTFAIDRKVSLSLHDASLKQLFKAIEKQSKYKFSYLESEVKNKSRVSVQTQEKSIEQTLEEILKSRGLDYSIAGNTIVVTPRNTQSQPKSVEGVILDQQGIPMIGVSITLKSNPQIGTVTDLDGNFSFGDLPENEKLLVSYIGYKTLLVNPTSTMKIVMEENNQLLEEVVVVGYGIQKKKDLTGAVASIKGDDIAGRKTTNLSSALQGSAAGLMVTRNGSEPGSGASNIYVRGVTTISDSSPLVIVDGVPGSIDHINPDDVESISVLKDAASASIYGSRAASGVILITTKTAKENDLKLTYSVDVGYEIPTRQPEFVDVTRFLEMSNELRYNDNPAGGLFQAYSEDQQLNWVKHNQTDPDNYPITDWTDLVLKDYSNRQNHNISISGGSKNVKSQLSLSYLKSDALYDNYEYQRYMVRSNNNITISKMLSANLNVNFIHSESDKPLKSPFSLVDGIRVQVPVYAAVWQHGGYASAKSGDNIYAMIQEGGSAKSWSNRIQGKAAINFSPFEGFKISAVVAPNYSFGKGKTFRNKIPYYTAQDPNQIEGYMTGHETSSLSESRSDSYNITSQIIANYINTFGKHDLNVMAGYENYYSHWESLGASRDNYILENYPYLNLGPKDFQFNSGSADHYAYRSWFGRVGYTYDNRYLLQANVRTDGSSRFAKGHRWGVFPSFSAGWVLTEEKFLKERRSDWLSFLKLRASYGTLGNERIGSYHPYQAELSFEGILLYNGNTPEYHQTAAQWNYAVEDITWETTTSYDLGLDARFFNNQLSLTFDYYQKYTRDMLIATQIPGVVGFGNPAVNAGKMNTKGFDLELGWNDNIGKFNYSISANLSDFTSRMDDLNGTQFLGSQVKMEGSEFNEWYGYVSDGLFLTQEDVDNSPKLNKNVKVGDIKYKDISGPDGKPDGKISAEYDRVLLGGSLPRFTYGGVIACSYSNFDLSVTLQGVGKRNVMMGTDMVQPLRANWSNITKLIDGHYWSENNTEAQNAEALYPRLTYSNAGVNYTTSDYWMFNGRYLRVKNLTVGYSLPKSWMEKIFVENARFYISANDLYCFSKYPKGWDPELGSTAYPITTSVLFGLSINF